MTAICFFVSVHGAPHLLFPRHVSTNWYICMTGAVIGGTLQTLTVGRFGLTKKSRGVRQKNRDHFCPPSPGDAPMKIECDNCGTRYRVDARKIGVDGNRVRCIRCRHIFSIFPPGADGEQTLPTNQGSREPDFDHEEGTSFAPEAPKAEKTDDACTFFDAFPGYEMLEPLGRGGMANVTLAKDRQLLRRVAIKTIKPGADSPTALAYFCREAQITAQLDHPNIVPLYTVKPSEGAHDGIAFVMKLVRGQTLRDLIREAADQRLAKPRTGLAPHLNLTSRLTYFIKACEGLHFAHEKLVIHRDLKPSNIMVGHFGEVYLMDWGVAGILEGEKAAVEISGTERFVRHRVSCDETLKIDTSEAMGTPGYMAPEQARGETPTDAAGDIFSMGMVLHELVTLKRGRLGDVAQRMEMARDAVLEPFSTDITGRSIPPALVAVIEKATALDPGDRYGSIMEMAEDIQHFLRDEAVSVYPDNWLRTCWRVLGRHREMTLLSLMAMILVFFIIASWGLWREQQALKNSRMREKALTALQAAVSKHAHGMDCHFLRLGGLATNLAAQAAVLMDTSPPNREALYTLTDFKDPWTAPEDFAHSPLYGKKVSIDYPVVKIAPGVKRNGILEYMRPLAQLRHGFRHALLASKGIFGPVSPGQARHLLTVVGVPVRWAFLGLEPGVMFSYPGKATYASDYDPRKRPWYRLGAGKRGLQWGIPYVDVQGQGLVLPCSVPVFGKDRRFNGVLGMDVTLKDIVQDYMRRPGAAGVLESYLLNAKGAIVIRSGRKGEAIGPVNLENARAPKPFPVPRLVAAIGRKDSGLMELDRASGPSILVYDRLPSLGWFYLESLDAADILGE